MKNSCFYIIVPKTNHNSNFVFRNTSKWIKCKY